MSLLQKRGWTMTADQLIPPRAPSYKGSVYIDVDTGLRHSGIWAALRIRADMVSTMRLNVVRTIQGLDVTVNKPQVMVSPGENLDMNEFLYGTQMDLDRSGNTFGIITKRTPLGLVAEVDPVPLQEVAVRARGRKILEYRIAGKGYKPEQIWHERQYVVAGLPLGLSPIQYGAYSAGAYLSAQEFILDWYEDGTIPAAMLRNNAKTVTGDQATEIRNRFKAAVAGRDLFVTGNDWEYQMIQAEAAQVQFIESMNYGIADIGRFFAVPADLLDAAVKSGSRITYANSTQRMLDFLLLAIQPMLTRRETALSKWLPDSRRVEFDTHYLLRMDPAALTTMLAAQIATRILTPTEGRQILNRAKFTQAQINEFNNLFGEANPEPPPAPIIQAAPVDPDFDPDDPSQEDN